MLINLNSAADEKTQNGQFNPIINFAIALGWISADFERTLSARMPAGFKGACRDKKPVYRLVGDFIFSFSATARTVLA